MRLTAVTLTVCFTSIETVSPLRLFTFNTSPSSEPISSRIRYGLAVGFWAAA
jgi:hypothetical protein